MALNKRQILHVDGGSAIITTMILLLSVVRVLLLLLQISEATNLSSHSTVGCRHSGSRPLASAPPAAEHAQAARQQSMRALSDSGGSRAVRSAAAEQLRHRGSGQLQQ